MTSEQTPNLDSTSASFFSNLSDDNWGTWFSAIESHFLIKYLDGILDESELAPPPPDLTGTRTFAKRKKHIAGIIGLKLVHSICERLVTDLNCRDPVIKSHFASTKARSRGQVFFKLFSLSCAENDVSDFITSAKKTLNELSAIGVQTNSEMISHFLLHLLPPHLESFKDMVIYTAKVTDKALSVDSVINLLQQNVNDKRTQAVSSRSGTALSATISNSSTGPIGRFKQPIWTNGQHNPATQHSASRCWQLHPELRNARALRTANAITTLLAISEIAQLTPPVMTRFLLAAFSKTSSKV